MRSPKTLTITDANGSPNLQYLVEVVRNAAVVGSHSYQWVSTSTVCPVGSDGTLDNVQDGQAVDFVVTETNPLGSGEPFTVSGGPYTVGTYPSGPQSVTVQL